MNQEIEELRQDIAECIDDAATMPERLHAKGYRKPKVGRWIKPSPFSDPVCSECNRSPKRVGDMLAPFFPECGAKMEGEKEDGC